jgi:hypothetical protein
MRKLPEVYLSVNEAQDGAIVIHGGMPLQADYLPFSEAEEYVQKLLRDFAGADEPGRVRLDVLWMGSAGKWIPGKG